MNTALAILVPLASLAVIVAAINWERIRAWIWRRDETQDVGADRP